MSLKYSLILLLFSQSCFADISVIVNQKNDIMSLSKLDIKRIYMGKLTLYENGSNIDFFTYESDVKVNEVFLKIVAKQSPSQFRAYWAKQIFTGKGVPPKNIESIDQMIQVVKNNINALGFVDSSLSDIEGVKVVATFP